MSIPSDAPNRHPMNRGVPKWSPDGSQLLVELGRRPTLVDRELNTVTEFGPKDTWVTGSDWSPDGEQITYSYRGVHEGQELPHWGVFSSTPDGKDEQVLSNTGWRASWSPDGQSLAYHIVKYDAPIRIGVMNRDGKEERELSEEFTPGSHYWSPDSRTLVFERWEESGGRLFRVDLEEGEIEPLMERHDESDKSATFAPDGKSLLFERFYSEGRRTEIRRLDLETGEDSLFSDLHRSNHDAAFSPDGSQVVFSSNTVEGDFNLYLADADGSEVTQLTSLAGDEYAPSWSPDGKSLAFYHYDSSAPADNRKSVRILEID